MCSFKQYRLISFTECLNSETHCTESSHWFNTRKITAKITTAATTEHFIFSTSFQLEQKSL